MCSPVAELPDLTRNVLSAYIYTVTADNLQELFFFCFSAERAAE
jgi:hypothetical protein